MYMLKWSSSIFFPIFIYQVLGADDDYNVLNTDGSYEFGYNNPDSFHHSQANRNNVVRGEFGGRNPQTGGIDRTQYTAGPRGFRPRGKNIVRKYDLNQNGPRPIGSKDDPYFDPYEDPSYNFGFKTRTYNRQEGADRFGTVKGGYSYRDDIGELHNVQYIAGRNTGFNVLTPYPDNDARRYGNFYVGRPVKGVQRGKTSISRKPDGSYSFVSVGPNQRRTEESNAKGFVRGSYTYRDEKGVLHAVHYIAGPGIGYRVLKNVRGPHIPNVLPFDSPPNILPDLPDSEPELFHTAASGHVTPNKNNIGGIRPTGTTAARPSLQNGVDLGTINGNVGRPASSAKPFSEPNYSLEDDDTDVFGDDIFPSSPSSTLKPTDLATPSRPSSTLRPNDLVAPVDTQEDDGSYKPEKYGDTSSLDRPAPGGDGGDVFGSLLGGTGTNADAFGSGNGFSLEDRPIQQHGGQNNFGVDIQAGFGTPPTLQIGINQGGVADSINNDGLGVTNSNGFYGTGTIVTNVGDTLFTVPPGVSVRAHVQSIDLLPLLPRSPSPSEQYKVETSKHSEQLNAETSNFSTHVSANPTNYPTSTISSIASSSSPPPVTTTVTSSTSFLDTTTDVITTTLKPKETH